MKYFGIWLSVLFLGFGLGCAQTSQAIKVFKAGHDQIQEMVDTTQSFCQHSRSLLIEKQLDTSVLEAYCEKAWEQFKTYKKITDAILKD